MRAVGRGTLRGLGRTGRGVGHGLLFAARGVAALARANTEAVIAVVTGILFVIAWSTLSASHSVPGPLQPLVALVEVAPLLLVWARPFVGWALCLGAASVIAVAVPRTDPHLMSWPVVQFLVLLALVIAVGVRATWQQVVTSTMVTSGVCFILLPDNLKAWGGGQLVFVLIGLLIRWLVQSRRELAVEAELSEAERERRAVVEERSAIARELHDIVAHHMSMIVVQSQSAPYRLTGVTDDVRAEFASIETSARAALNEIRGVLGVLRTEDQRPDAAPLPGGADIESLLEGTRAAGVPLTWPALPEALPSVGAPVGLAAYRILQEALANASRHAQGADVLVLVALTDSQLTVSVDNGAGEAPEPGGADPAGGNGLRGMRTRAESVGGALDAEPVPGGGFHVRAVLPVPAGVSRVPT